MTATIRREAQRYSTWMQIFGGDTVTIIEPPKDTPKGPRMLVDVTALTAEQRGRLAAKISRSLQIPSDRVMKELMESGCVPISAEDVDVRSEEARLF